MKPEVIERCCRDLRTYLETTLAGAKGGVVSVKLNRVLEVGHAHMWKMRYAQCLSRLLRRYRFNEVYLLTRQQAEELLNSLDAHCAELHERREERRKRPKQEEPTCTPEAVPVANGERMPNVSFHLPRALLQALDEYARRMNLTRSDVIRMAIKQMLDKIYAAEEKEELEYIIAV